MISSTLFWIKNRLFRPEAHKAWKEANDYLLASKEEKILQSWNDRKAIVQYAYDNCKFYRQFYDSVGFNPSMLKEEGDWKRVPVIEKQMIRNNFSDFISLEAQTKDLRIGSTGGSTGEPLKFYKSSHVHYEVLAWRSLRAWGISPSDNEGILHRRVPQTYIEKIRNVFLWWPTRRAFLCATTISQSAISSFIEDIRSKKIKWLVGYCATIEHVADYVINHQLSIDHLQLVWTTSSPLTDLVRKKLEQAFHCPIMDQYGCCELGHIAVQLPKENGLSVHSDYVHLDIVDKDGEIVNSQHSLGEIVITDLKTKEFPFIKYRLGDTSRCLLTMNESEDGMPRIDFVRGRTCDVISLPDGSCLEGVFLTTLFDDYADEISCYQIYQKADYSVSLFYVSAQGEEGLEVKCVPAILHRMKELSHNQLSINPIPVKEIPDNAGKRKFIISEIKSPDSANS